MSRGPTPRGLALRDAILAVLRDAPGPMRVQEITAALGTFPVDVPAGTRPGAQAACVGCPGGCGGWHTLPATVWRRYTGAEVGSPLRAMLRLGAVQRWDLGSEVAWSLDASTFALPANDPDPDGILAALDFDPGVQP